MVCVAGATLQLIYGLIAVPFPYAQAAYGWDEILWALANVGIVGGALGVFTLDVARPRSLGVVGAALAVLGNLNRFAVSGLLILAPSPEYLALILISILLIVLGMGALGVATLLGRQLTGRQALMLLVTEGFTLLPAASYSVNQSVHFILLGLWGFPWMLVGWVVPRHTRGRPQHGGRFLAGATRRENGLRLARARWRSARCAAGAADLLEIEP